MSWVNKIGGLRIAAFFLVVWGAQLFIAGPSGAMQLLKSNDIRVPGEDTIQGPVLVTGKTVYIDGTIDGDLYILGSEIQINGVVKGDLLAVAANIGIKGIIEGNLRTFCGTTDIDGRVEENVSLLGSKITVGPQGVVGKSLLLGVLRGDLQGEIKDQVCGWGSNVAVQGIIGRGIDFFKVGNLTIDSGSKIGGDVKYSSTNKATIYPGAIIAERVKWDKQQSRDSFLSIRLLWMVAGLLVWWFLNLLLPGIWDSIVSPAVNRPVAAASWGIMAFLIIPLVALLMLFTVVGVSLALMLIALYVVIVYMGQIIAGYSLGYVLYGRFNWQDRMSPPVWFLISYVAIVLLGGVPFVGLPVRIIAVCWSLGVIIWLIVNKRRQITGRLGTEIQ